MNNAANKQLITCQACGEKREPHSFRAIFCAPCWAEIEADMAAPLPVQTETPKGFRKIPVIYP